MPRVVLHIGAFKTGTSFLQETLARNKAALAADGVLFPGSRWPDQIQAVRALTARPDPGAAVPQRGRDAWDDLAAECREWNGELAVISMEFLSTARPAVAAAAIASFDPTEVTVVLGARDLVDAVPAQWQESLQSSGRTWTLEEYADAVMWAPPTSSEASRHFWRRHNWPQVLARWRRSGPPGATVLLTMPRRGAPPELLWHRFGSAAGFDATRYPVAPRTNESLGAASLEVARRVNMEARHRGLSTAGNPTFRRVLCKRVMASRRSAESGVALRPGCEAPLGEATQRLLDRVQAIDPLVVGNVDELRPAGPPRADACTMPDQLPDDELLEAARHGAVGLARALGVPWHEPDSGSASARLASIVRDLTDMTTATT